MPNGSAWLSIAATSAVVSAIVSQASQHIRDRLRDRRQTRLAALRTAVALEGYVLSCANEVSDHDLSRDSDGYAGKPSTGVPDVPDLEVAPGFLGPKRGELANRLEILRQEAEQADQNARFWWDVVGDHEAAQHAAAMNTARLGLQSLQLAKDLRCSFRLPERELIFGEHNVEKALQRGKSKAKRELE